MSARRDAIDAAFAARGIDIAGDLSRYELKEVIRIVEVMGGRIRLNGGVRASYDTDPDQGANAAIVFTAVPEGAWGNLLSVQYVAGGTAGAEAVSNTIGADGQQVIAITIQTGVSTAAQVIAALDAEDLSSLLSYALKAGNSGAGAVVTMAAKPLTGGQDAALVISPVS